MPARAGSTKGPSMTPEQEERVALEFARKHPVLRRLGFDGVRLYPDWAYLVLAAVLVLWVCAR